MGASDGLMQQGFVTTSIDTVVNWTRTGFLRILRRMRGIVLGDLEDDTGELVADEPVSGSCRCARD